MVSVFSTLLGSTADTCSASVYEVFFEEFYAFLREVRTFGSFGRSSSFWLQTVESPQLQSTVGRRHLFRGAETASLGPDSCQTIDFLQLLYKVVDVPVCRSCRFPCRGAQACPVVQTVWTIAIPQLQFLDMVIDAPVVQVCTFPVPSRWRQSSSHSCHC